MPCHLARSAALAAALVFLAGPLLAQAAEPWPDLPPEFTARGPGFYLSWFKILAGWLVFVAWVFTSDWVNRDCHAQHHNHQRWNSLIFGVFLAAFLLTWLLPWFWLSLPLLLVAYVAPLAAYIAHRNQAAPPHEQVLTQDHFYFLFASVSRKAGVKVELERPAPVDRGCNLTLKARGGPSPRDEDVRLLTARQTPGFLAARQLVCHGLESRAAAIMLDFRAQAVGLKYQIDGIWIETEAIAREQGDPALESLKTLCGLDPQERAKHQQGAFLAELAGATYNATLISQGVAGGERAVIQLQGQRFCSTSLEELGMRPKMREQLLQALNANRGLVLFSALPAGGLRTTMNAALCSLDRLMRDFLALEEEAAPYPEVENVSVITYRAKPGPRDALTSLLLKDPEVVVVRDLVDTEMVRQLCLKAADDKLIITSIRAKDAAEALARVLALKVPPTELAQAVTAVLHQRLVRMLCTQCREAYRPTPEVLQQLNLPADRVQAFYRPPQQITDKPCPACGGIGYRGRVAIYELLLVDPRVRSALQSGAKLELIRKAARQAGTLSLQEEGLVLVAKGITSLPELARVLAE